MTTEQPDYMELKHLEIECSIEITWKLKSFKSLKVITAINSVNYRKEVAFLHLQQCQYFISHSFSKTIRALF